MIETDFELKPYANDDTYIELHRLYLKAIQKYSAKGFIKHLRSLIVKGDIKSREEDSTVEFILTCIVDEWKEHKIKKKDLFESKARGELVLARKMAFIVINETLKISDTSIGIFFNYRSRQIVFKTIQAFKKIGTTKPERIFMERYKNITSKVLQYMNTHQKNDY